jgi:hypothetical protein
MGVPPEPKPASPPDWDNTMEVIIHGGITYVEADAVTRWLKRVAQGNLSTRDLPKIWDDNVNHVVRQGIEKETKKWWHW